MFEKGEERFLVSFFGLSTFINFCSNQSINLLYRHACLFRCKVYRLLL